MKDLKDEELKKIVGGSAFTSTAIKYVSDLIVVIIEMGRKLGTSIRRMESGNICPLE